MYYKNLLILSDKVFLMLFYKCPNCGNRWWVKKNVAEAIRDHYEWGYYEGGLTSSVHLQGEKMCDKCDPSPNEKYVFIPNIQKF